MSNQVLSRKSLVLKAALTEAGEFIAVASVQVVDLQDELIIIDGIKVDATPLPLYYNHISSMQVGEVVKTYKEKDTETYYEEIPVLKVEAYIDLNDKIKSEKSKEEREELRQDAKKGKMELSIGVVYDEADTETQNIYGRSVNVIKSCILKEVSLTYKGVNTETKIEAIKSQQSNNGVNIKKELQEKMKSTYSMSEFVDCVYQLSIKGYLSSKNSISNAFDDYKQFSRRCTEAMEKQKAIQEDNKKGEEVLSKNEKMYNYFCVNKK